MSSTGRTDNPRAAADMYETPPAPIRGLLDAGGLPIKALGEGPTPRRWLEPSAGRGAIIKTVGEWCSQRKVRSPNWHAVEIRRSAEEDLRAAATLATLGSSIETADFLELYPPAQPYDVALGNPPFRLAFDFVQKLVDERWAYQVTLLLRIGFLESAARYAWLKDNVPDIYTLTSRPSFTDGGQTDSAMYAWMSWYPFLKKANPSIKLLPPRDRNVIHGKDYL